MKTFAEKPGAITIFWRKTENSSQKWGPNQHVSRMRRIRRKCMRPMYTFDETRNAFGSTSDENPHVRMSVFSLVQEFILSRINFERLWWESPRKNDRFFSLESWILQKFAFWLGESLQKCSWDYVKTIKTRKLFVKSQIPVSTSAENPCTKTRIT